MSNKQPSDKAMDDNSRKPAPNETADAGQLSKDELDKATGGLLPAVAPQK